MADNIQTEKKQFPKARVIQANVPPKHGATYVSIHSKVIFSKATGKNDKVAPHAHVIPSSDTILVKHEDGRLIPKRIVYTQGMGWVKKNGIDEQVPKEGLIALKRGRLIVGQDKQDLYEYLEECNYNGSNPNRNKNVNILFYRVDEGKAKKEAATAELDYFKNMEIFFKMLEDKSNTDQLMNYLIVNGVDTEEMDEDAYVTELTLLAKADPKKFVANVANPINTRMADIKAGIKTGELEYKEDGRKYFWSGSTNHIYHVPAGVTDPVQNFAEWTITDKGESVYAELRKRLKLK